MLYTTLYVLQGRFFLSAVHIISVSVSDTGMPCAMGSRVDADSPELCTKPWDRDTCDRPNLKTKSEKISVERSDYSKLFRINILSLLIVSPSPPHGRW